jgi:ankyrin repeat protein
VNAQDEEGMTPLMHAVLQGNIEMIQLLLKSIELKINLQDNQGNTALHHALITGKNISTIIPSLLARGADVTIADVEGNVPLEVAYLLAEAAPEIAQAFEAFFKPL